MSLFWQRIQNRQYETTGKSSIVTCGGRVEKVVCRSHSMVYSRKISAIHSGNLIVVHGSLKVIFVKFCNCFWRRLQVTAERIIRLNNLIRIRCVAKTLSTWSWNCNPNLNMYLPEMSMQGWKIYWEHTIGRWVLFIEEKDSGWCYVNFFTRGQFSWLQAFWKGDHPKRTKKTYVSKSHDATIAIVRVFSDKSRGNFRGTPKMDGL